MILVGRHHRVRGVGPWGITPSAVLSYPVAQGAPRLRRYRDEDWAYDARSGLVLPALRGGSGWRASAEFTSPNIGLGALTLTQTTLPLDSAYTYNSAGDAIAAMLPMPATRTLNGVYTFITGYTGTTPANVNDLDVEVRNHGASKPGTTLHASGSINPASATGWVVVTGLSFSMVAGTIYWAIVADADGNGTDYATVLRNTTSVLDLRMRSQAMQTTDGWATVITAGQAQASLVLAFADGTAYGWPYTVAATPSNNTNRRGFNISQGFSGDCRFYGMFLTQGNNLTGGSGLEVWEANSGPSGTPFASTSLPFLTGSSSSTTPGAYIFGGGGLRLFGHTPYRIVYSFSGNSTSVPRLQIGTGVDAALRAARVGGGAWYWAGANGTTDWSNDNVDEMPGAGLLLEDLWDAYDGTAFGRRRTDAPTLMR